MGKVRRAIRSNNSREEKDARAAMARRIRDFMQGFLAEVIALAIDPNTPSHIIGLKPLRMVRFESVARGKASTWRRDLRVLHFIRMEIGNTVKRGKDGVPRAKIEAALQAAVAEFGISRSTAQAIWKRHQEAMADAVRQGLEARK
jgi:hypothetical protein